MFFFFFFSSPSASFLQHDRSSCYYLVKIIGLDSCDRKGSQDERTFSFLLLPFLLFFAYLAVCSSSLTMSLLPSALTPFWCLFVSLSYIMPCRVMPYHIDLLEYSLDIFVLALYI